MIVVINNNTSHRYSSKQTFEGAKDFFPNIPDFFPNVLPTNFLPQRSWKPYLMWPPKKDFGRHFLKSNNAGNHFCPDFQGLCPDFWQIKTFGGALGTPAPPASYTTDNSSCTVVTIDLVIFWAHSRKNVPVCKPKFFCKRDFWIESGCVLIVQVKLFIAYCAKFSDIFSFMWLSGIWRAPDQSLKRRLRGFWGRFLEVQTIM